MDLTHKQAMELALSVKWEVVACEHGDKCWCRGINPIEKIEYGNNEEIYIIGTGSIDRKFAKHIVELHNKYIDHGNGII